MTANDEEMQAEPTAFRAVLMPHRSLPPRAFLVLMGALAAVSVLAGGALWLLGAWPVFGFYGLDVLAIYIAFRLNYRAGRAYETVEVTPSSLRLTRVDAAGRTQQFDYHPYWARVRLRQWPDGRTDLRLISHGKELVFARFLTDDERRDFASALSAALFAARSAPRG
jgi:uncharacterized membrane protein